MKCTLTLALLLLTALAINLYADDPPMPDYWTRYEDMKVTMDSLSNAFPNIIQIESLGQTETDNIDLWCAKISSDAQSRRDVPRILIIGSIHSEEVIGNEIAMKLMRDLIYKRNQPPYSNWLQNLEIFIIPAMNPEGLSVVMEGGDNSFRKNKKDTNGNGIFDFVPGTGQDIDGVDLNRNWDANWVQGDTLYAGSGYETYDYYRGEYPFSENETRAVRDLAYREKFAYGIVWHSSRTGNLSEKVYTPYNYASLRPAPDWDINSTIGQGVASKIFTQEGTLTYSAFPATGRKGEQHVWFYSQLGTVMLLIECGTLDLQPSLEILQGTIARCTLGMNWLIDRALPTGTANPYFPKPMLSGRIKDAITQEPLAAQIIIEGRESESVATRLSNAEHGRFWWPLVSGLYTYTVRKKGYEPFTGTAMVSDSRLTVNVSLIPLTPVNINLTIHSNNTPISAQVTLSDPCGDDVYSTENGSLTINTFIGSRKLTIIPANGIPVETILELTHSTNINVNVGTANSIFTENFDIDLSAWTVISGPWRIVEHEDKTFLTDSWGGTGFYAPGVNAQIRTTNPIAIPANTQTYLLFDQHLHTEIEHDFVYVSVSTDLSEWTDLYQKAGKYDFWHKNLINLSDYAGQSIYIRFRLQDDTTNNSDVLALVDPGWSIDNLKIITGVTILNDADIYMPTPQLALYQNYPNPFNPETHIPFNIQNVSFSSANIDIFNIKGQKVQTIDISSKTNNYSYVIWNADKLSSGIYFYRLSLDGKTISTKKALLIK